MPDRIAEAARAIETASKPTLVEQVSPYMVKLADILQMAAQSDDPQVIIRKVVAEINKAAGRTLITMRD